MIGDEEIDNNFNARKIRISVKGDTVDYRKYREFIRNSGQGYTTNKGVDFKMYIIYSYQNILKG